ncbi:MAG: hypothetical protein AB8H03_08025 [Saprospiraceae bacterium]
MKNLIKIMHERMLANFTLMDYGFLKVYGAIFGLVVGAFFPTFVKSNLVVFIIIFSLLLIRYLYLLFWKKADLKMNAE